MIIARLPEQQAQRQPLSAFGAQPYRTPKMNPKMNLKMNLKQGLNLK